MANTAIDVLEKHARGGTWWLDLDTQALWWSPGVYRLHALDPVRGQPGIAQAVDFFDAESRARIEAALETATRYGTGWNLTLRMIRADGKIRYVQAVGQVELRPGQQPLLAGAVFDVHAQVVLERRRQAQARRFAEENRRSRAALEESRRRLEQTLKQAPIGIALVAPDGHWLQVNRALCDIVGYSESELLTLSFQDITHPDDLNADLALLEAVLEGRRRSYRMEKRYFHKDGHAVDIQLDVSLLREEDGKPLHFISQIQDISAYKRANEALFEARELAEVTIEAIGEGVIRTDGDGVIRAANGAAELLLGVPGNSLDGRVFSDAVALYEARSEQRLACPVAEVLTRDARVHGPLFTRLRRADGQYISISDSASPIHDRSGAIRGVVFVFQDVSEVRRANDDLVHRANHDPLTSLPNRRGFEEAVKRIAARGRATDANAYVLYLDLDRFKAVNDRCGHAGGDELLRRVAFALRDSLRGSDFLARIGGDEFAAVAFVDGVQGAAIVGEKLVRTIDGLRFCYNGEEHRIGLSVGMARLDGPNQSIEVALGHADAALYTAKANGRGRYHLYCEEQRSGADESPVRSEQS